MSRKSTLVLLLIVGLILLSCNLVTPTSRAQLEPTLTQPPADTLAPSATPVPTAEPSLTPRPDTPTPTEAPTETATQTLAYRAPFAGWSEEYQLIQVPPALQEELNAGKAKVVPLPTDKSTYTRQFYGLVSDESFLGPFDFERLASFQDQASFAAVPARNIPEVPDFREKGLMVGLVYDSSAFYGTKRSAVYEVYFFDKKAEVRDHATGGVVRSLESGKDYFWTESKSNPEALTFFIKGSCWLCWNAGGRTGCLICF